MAGMFRLEERVGGDWRAGHWAMERERQGIGDGERVLAGERENIPVYWARREFRVSKIISGRLFSIFDHLLRVKSHTLLFGNV
jgi:hypothetical protein